jgi:hypothetical protein
MKSILIKFLIFLTISGAISGLFGLFVRRNNQESKIVEAKNIQTGQEFKDGAPIDT